MTPFLFSRPRIWLQIFASAYLPQRKPALIYDARSKVEQDHSDDGNPIQ
ncbi:hypothetical protein V1283_005074 [Bradyrhizobium sp. AZCC 2262]